MQQMKDGSTRTHFFNQRSSLVKRRRHDFERHPNALQIHLTAVLKCYGFARRNISFGTSLSISHLKTGSNYIPNGQSARRIIWEIEYTVHAMLWPAIRCLFSVNWWGIWEHVSLLILGNEIHLCGRRALKLLCSNAAWPDTGIKPHISLPHVLYAFELIFKLLCQRRKNHSLHRKLCIPFTIWKKKIYVNHKHLRL